MAWMTPAVANVVPIQRALPRSVSEAGSPSSIAVLPASVDLSLYAGDDFLMTITLTNADGTPADLSGASASAQIRVQPGAAIAATFTASIAANVVTLQLKGVDTQNLTGNYVWDCQVVYGSGITSTVTRGAVTYTADVTR